MTGTGSLRGGPTTRAEHCKEPFFSSPLPWDELTGRAACGAPPPAGIPAGGTYQPLITKIIGLHLQHSSQRRLWSGNWSPGLSDCVMRVRINRGSLGFLEGGEEWGKQCIAGEVWCLIQLSWGLPFLHAFAHRELVCFLRALLAPWRFNRDWQLLFRKWPRNVAAHRGKCSFTHASAEEMVSPSVPPPPAPQIPEGQDTTNGAETDVTILL